MKYCGNVSIDLTEDEWAECYSLYRICIRVIYEKNIEFADKIPGFWDIISEYFTI